MLRFTAILAATGAFIVLIAALSVKEDFWNIPSRTWKIEKVSGGCDGIQTPCLKTRLPGCNTEAMEMLASPPTSDRNCGSEARDMTELTIGPDGEPMAPIVYDRYIVANRNSRLRAHGDKIRGDLPIAPMTGNWFSPNVHPNVDLEAGAINVLAGVDNDTSKQLAHLINSASGGLDTTIGGVDLNADDR